MSTIQTSLRLSEPRCRNNIYPHLNSSSSNRRRRINININTSTSTSSKICRALQSLSIQLCNPIAQVCINIFLFYVNFLLVLALVLIRVPMIII